MPLPAFAPIETERLSIRPVEASDLPALLDVNRDPEVTRYLPYDAWTGAAEGEAWLARMEKLVAGGDACQLVIVERDLGRAIGTCLVFRYSDRDRLAEIGYVLGRAYWGRGYMLEALTALIGAAFNAVHLRRLEANVAGPNFASLKLLERTGFVHEGLLRERWIARGEVADCAVFGLLRADWEARRNREPEPQPATS
jgi:[ribosomal protein S5]-alanine N-acetyltransferase